MSKKNFLKLIQEQRKNSKKEKFEGNFLDFLGKVKEQPELADPAHKRLYDTLVSHGVNAMLDSNPRKNKIFDGENIKIYDYFKDEFFGTERVISKIMRFLKSAALKGEESRQVLLLMGPVGAGKSAITEHIKSSLEGVSYFHIDGDPQRGNPLHLVPRSLRTTFEEELNVKIDGDVSPPVRYSLLNDLNGKYEDFKIPSFKYKKYIILFLQ